MIRFVTLSPDEINATTLYSLLARQFGLEAGGFYKDGDSYYPIVQVTCSTADYFGASYTKSDGTFGNVTEFLLTDSMIVDKVVTQ